MSPPTIPPAPPATHTPHLPSDLHTLKSEYIEHLLRVLREKWDGGAAQYALESRIYGALARLTSTARAAAEEYRELAEAYEGLRGREPVVAELSHGADGTGDRRVADLEASLSRAQEANAGLRRLVRSQPDLAVELSRTRRRNQELVREMGGERGGTSPKPVHHLHCTSLANSFKDVCEFQVLPFIADYSAGWVRKEWTGLYRRVCEWVDIGYMGGGEGGLFMDYAREVAEGVEVGKVRGENRGMLCVGLVYRVLHEEVFEALRGFLGVEIPAVGGRKRKLDEGAELGGRKRVKCHELMEPEPADSTDTPPSVLLSPLADCAEPNPLSTTLAKTMKHLFTLPHDPLRPHLLQWRSDVVDLIFDIVEPLRTLSPGRRALKGELWKIVKQAFALAVTLRCQREEYTTLLEEKGWLTICPALVKGGVVLVEGRIVDVSEMVGGDKKPGDKEGEELEAQMLKELGEN